MKLRTVSYTTSTGSTDSTINDNSTWSSKVLLRPLVPDAEAQYADAGDGQEPQLTGMKLISATLELSFTYLGSMSGIGAAYSTLAALFDKRDKTERTLILKDIDDSDFQWQCTCRNKGVGIPDGRTVTVRVALTSEILLAVNATTETTWTNASSAPKSVTINKGNISALPSFTISPNASTTNGNKYKRFVTTYNYTKRGAIGYPIEITNGGLDTSNIIYTAGAYFTINAPGTGINASVTTIPYDNPAGSLPTTYPFNIYSSGEQMKVTARTGTTSGNLTVVRGVNGSTAGSHSDNEQLALSKMAYDGRDIRIVVGDGNGNSMEVPRWFGGAVGATGGMNTSATKIWIPYNYAARAVGTLLSSINDTDVTLTLDPTTIDGAFDPTDGLLIIGSEIIPYSSAELSSLVFSGLIRGGKGSTADVHSAGDTVRAINEIWMYYGNGAPTTPVYSDALKPMFVLTSTNSAWNFGSFASIVNTSQWEWKQSANGTYLYTQDASGTTPFLRPATTDPVTVMGIGLSLASSYGEWILTIPFGMTGAVFTTIKRLNLPANQAFLLAKEGTQVTSVAISSAGASWSTTASLSITASASRLSLYLKNTQTTWYAAVAAVQVETVSVALSTATTSDDFGIPYISMGSEQVITSDLDAKLTNTVTGDIIYLKFPDIAIGSSLRFNTFRKTITYSADERSAFQALQRYVPRTEWLQALYGSNSFTFSQAGWDIVISWRGRSNTFG